MVVISTGFSAIDLCTTEPIPLVGSNCPVDPPVSNGFQPLNAESADPRITRLEIAKAATNGTNLCWPGRAALRTTKKPLIFMRLGARHAHKEVR